MRGGKLFATLLFHRKTIFLYNKIYGQGGGETGIISHANAVFSWENLFFEQDEVCPRGGGQKWLEGGGSAKDS